MTVGDFANHSRGQLVGLNGTEPLNGFSLDSREVVPGSLFLAIRGERHDGHDYAKEVIDAGALAVVAERPVEAPHILVDDLVGALARFGTALRDQFRGPVVGVTGSNGKTTTKEFIAAALSSLGPVLKSPANKNTEYSSPLVWAEIGDQKSAVIEMAMRGAGQIAHLASISKPTIGVVTMIGTAHVEKVGSREGVMEAKAELLRALPKDGTAIVWREDDFWAELNERSSAPVRSFGFSPEAECRIVGYRAIDWSTCAIRLSLDEKVVESTLPVLGRHQARNAAAALLAAHTAGAEVFSAAEKLASADLPPMRLEVVVHKGATVLLDTYNASPDSTVAAIEALNEVPTKGRKVAVLGEMRELGDFAESGHRMVGKALVGSAIEEVFLTGGPTRYIADEAKMAGYPGRVTSDDILDLSHVTAFLDMLEPGDVALIKGSRALGLEKAMKVANGS